MMDQRSAAPQRTAGSEPANKGGFAANLSVKLIALTILFVLIAEIFIYVPSVANFRNNWLTERVAQARIAALILEKAPTDALPRPLVEEVLANMDTSMIALRIENRRQLLAMSQMPPMVDFEIDLRKRNALEAIMRTFDILLIGGRRTVRVVGPAPGGGEFVEIVISEAPLRAALIGFSQNILMLSLFISGLTALLVFAALNGLIVRPVRRLAMAVLAFRSDPEDARSVIRPDKRSDEIGTLERSVADMQITLQQELRQREHLANLGLAVAKINHDMRNMLASAQLVADRISGLDDPNVQRFVPKLLDALDRAIAFCQSTLSYGKAQERPAELRDMDLAALVDDVADMLMLAPDGHPALHVEIPGYLSVRTDQDHLSRVLTNLLRNAIAALESLPHPARESAEIVVSARKQDGMVLIDVHDNGPGIPPKIRERLFRAFSGSSRPGGTGLGLAIAAELMRGIGGQIALVETGPTGTTFRLTLPAA
jgi:signal transduction histidine kinase